MTTISNYGLNLITVNSLTNQQSTLSLLSQEISSEQKYSDLTEYDPTDARNILDFQSSVTQRQSYLSNMQTVQDRLSVYDSTMTDMESIATQASTLATQNSAYSATTAANISQSATDYLKQLTDDLNQQVGGRYIYAGTRYTTPPVTDLTTLTNAPTATTTTNPALPSYDSDYSNATSFTVDSATAPTGNFTVGNVAIPWSQVAAGTVSSVYLNGSTTATTLTTPITLPNTSATTATQYGANMSSAINQVAADTTDIPATYGISALTATSSNGTVTMNFNGTTPLSVTPDKGGTTGEVTWVGGSAPDGTIAQTPNSDAAAYTQDSVLVDSNYSITYGVSSSNPSFQQLINGIRFISTAVAAGQSGNTATYQSDMQQASALINQGLSGIQTIHAGVASNQNILSQETSTQKSDITNLQNQLSDIQQVDLTQVGTEVNLLQTQLQASYSATAIIEQLSLVKYL